MGKACVVESCVKAGRQCGTIAMEQREEISKAFYGLGDLHLQQAQRAQVFPVAKFDDIWDRLKVCQTILGISEKTVRTAIQKKLPTGAVEAEKRRGRRVAAAQKDEAILRTITAHISRFPAVKSHYCHSSSSKQYLHPSLNIPKMYRMFTEEYVGQESPSFATDSRIFKKLDLGFNKPKKTNVHCA
ncbi:hypothetical protein RRG08_051777 [Elysia crispata]|uniref:Uncharacterized protein n=1 Tax=Elysia crispata TaxID=231223 RepID=A0AAE1CQX5_9GAST|nr:hypothetical protein RRG08_051777 [Elysia crispata]